MGWPMVRDRYRVKVNPLFTEGTTSGVVAFAVIDLATGLRCIATCTFVNAEGGFASSRLTASVRDSEPAENNDGPAQ